MEAIAGLILAAGAGRRYGSAPKQLADLDGRPLLQHAIDAQLTAGCLDRVVVVLGARAAEVARGIDPGSAELAVCGDWEQGRSAALRAGVAALAGAERILCTLGDQPHIGPAAIRRMANQPGGTRAAYTGRPGHPVVLGPAELTRLHHLRGEQGAQAILGRPALVECGDVGSDRDVDTPAALAAAAARSYSR